MVKVESPQDAAEATKEYVEVFTGGLHAAAQYYSYYYLVEIEDAEEFSFDFFDLNNKMYDAYLNYSVAVTYDEVFKIPAKHDEQKLREEIQTNLDDGVKQKAKTIAKIEGGLTITDIRGLPKEAKKAEQKAKLFSEWEQTLKAARFLFNLEETTDWFEWPAFWGGTAWAGVADVALQYEKVTKTTYVDMMWGVAHNGAPIIDKLNLDNEQDQKIARWMDKNVDNLQQKVRETANAPKAKLDPQDNISIYNHYLNYILTKVRRGEMEMVLQITALDDRKVKNWLRANNG